MVTSLFYPKLAKYGEMCPVWKKNAITNKQKRMVRQNLPSNEMFIRFIGPNMFRILLGLVQCVLIIRLKDRGAEHTACRGYEK